MKKRTLYGIVLVGIIVAISTGCRKDLNPLPDQSTQVRSMKDLQIPASFNWQTTREVSVTLGYDIPDGGSTYTRINVYDKEPYNGGKVLLSGSVGTSFSLVSKLRIPSALSTLFLQIQPANGASQLVSVPVADQINYTFSPGDGGFGKELSAVTEPDCGTGCDQTHSGSGSLSINDGLTHCITTSYSGSVSISNGTLKICGTFTGPIAMGDNNHNCVVIVTAGGAASISSMNMGKNAAMTVYPTATGTVTSMTMNQNAQLTNYGNLTINGNFTPNDLVQNFGTMLVNGMYNMNGSTGDLINSGTLTINSHWNVINEVTNTGSIEVFGDMNCNNSVFLNACKLIVHGVFHLNNCEFTNETGYIKVYSETKIQGGQSFMLLKNQSMISTKDLTVNADITGQGTMNEIMVTRDIRFNGPKVITGPIETAQTDGVLVSGSPANFVNGATFVSFPNITNVIPISACNPEGSNPPVTCPDTDGDGVGDCDDDYPDDPTRAYNNFTVGTAVYEDLWPSQGDYDVNDLVMYYKYNRITNAQNLVVDVVSKFYIKAVGASFQNGFGYQFDNVFPAQVASVTGYDFHQNYITLSGNGTESGQAKAVIIAFDNAENVIHRPGGPFFNTMAGQPVGTADTVTITVHFTAPLAVATVGTPPFNPFLIKDLTRGVEVHLPDYAPTSLANGTYFGTADDDSNPATGRYYKTTQNLPWAINLPVDFDYPYEYADVTTAYNHFAEWAQSGGTAYPDWYEDLPGYRTDANIYH